MMFLLGIICTFLVAVSGEFCYSDVEEACSSRPTSSVLSSVQLAKCSAKYGNIELLETDLQAYANANIESSFEYLLMSTHFGNYMANRDGFKEFYRKLSDKAWDDAIDVIKFITKRGIKMNFNQLPRFKNSVKGNKVLELNEINSLAKALDMQKQLATEALYIHSEAQQHSKRDASVTHYLEEHFIEDQAERIRTLAGHTSDLKNLLTEHDPSVAVFLFDEYLKKSL